MLNSHLENPLVILTLPQLQGIIQDTTRTAIEHYSSHQPPVQEPEQLLTVKECADLLKTTIQNIHAKKRNGQLPFVRMGGRVYFKRNEVMNSLKTIHIRKSHHKKAEQP